ncbi:hypothetical protein EXIGLDRAFT_107500 [Exidia glandulosa HHB12029]|uniref:Granulins domain-containing protein n=1 Tax=Exidia glandulosa HHB12029 TaxID=1314781 RepID=A0A166AE11_EXIGL|nr:hypothetical protein EXIGLDRAFT_107500 [Exidia glandulosa HHB12029]
MRRRSLLLPLLIALPTACAEDLFKDWTLRQFYNYANSSRGVDGLESRAVLERALKCPNPTMCTNATMRRPITLSRLLSVDRHVLQSCALGRRTAAIRRHIVSLRCAFPFYAVVVSHSCPLKIPLGCCPDAAVTCGGKYCCLPGASCCPAGGCCNPGEACCPGLADRYES